MLLIDPEHLETLVFRGALNTKINKKEIIEKLNQQILHAISKLENSEMQANIESEIRMLRKNWEILEKKL